MEENLKNILSKAEYEIDSALGLDDLEKIRVTYLGKKGKITDLKKNISKLPNDEKPIAGKLINETSKKIEKSLSKKIYVLNKEILEAKIKEEKIDVTAHFDKNESGHFALINQTLEELESSFENMGFGLVEGPEI